MVSFKAVRYIFFLQVFGAGFVSSDIVYPVSMDMVFLLDGSTSIGLDNFDKLKEFIIKVMQHFRVSRQESHIGAVLYSDNASIQVSFTDTQELSSIASKIRNIPYKGGNTYTNLGLDTSRTLFATAKGGRGHVPRAVIVINDGKSNGDNVAKSAENIKNDGIQILSLGIGIGFSLSELQAIASSPDHVHTYASADSLLSHSSDIGRAVCAVSRRPQLFFTSILEKTIMMGHVITNLHVTDDLECALKCLTNQVCFSFNYLENSRKCQLNYSNKRANPNDVIDDDQSIHYDMVFSPY